MDIVRYETEGTCSSFIEVAIEDDIIMDIKFYGGCNGNLNGISSLCKGMNVNDVVQKLQGIKCGPKSTSCPDQLAACLIGYLNEQALKQNTNV